MNTGLTAIAEQPKVIGHAEATNKSSTKKLKQLRKNAVNDSLKILQEKPAGISKKSWEQLSDKISSLISKLVLALSELLSPQLAVATKEPSAPVVEKSSTDPKSNTPSSSNISPEIKTAAPTQTTNTAAQFETRATTNTVSQEPVNNSNPALRATNNSDKTQSIFTQDGYQISTEGKDEAWVIIDPLGKKTRIWGDPHVTESDDDKWDFKERSSFIFGKNKVTVETVAAQDLSLSSKITVYSGDMRATISGIDKNKPVLDIIKSDGILDDSIRDDGDIFIMTKEQFGDDKFVLIKDVAEKFDPKFEKKVGVGEVKVFDTILTEEQKKLVGK
jgi:hypothetical protein